MAVLILGGIVRRNRAILHDHAMLRAWLPELCQMIGMRPVGEVHIQPYGHWEGGAPSAVLFIEESAILVHTYPEADYVEVVLHSCTAIPWEGDTSGPITEAIRQTLDLDIRRRYFLGDFNWRELVAQKGKE